MKNNLLIVLILFGLLLFATWSGSSGSRVRRYRNRKGQIEEGLPLDEDQRNW